MASEEHAGHVFVEVSETYKTKKEITKKDTNDLRTLIIPKYEDIALGYPTWI